MNQAGAKLFKLMMKDFLLFFCSVKTMTLKLHSLVFKWRNTCELGDVFWQLILDFLYLGFSADYWRPVRKNEDVFSSPQLGSVDLWAEISYVFRYVLINTGNSPFLSEIWGHSQFTFLTRKDQMSNKMRMTRTGILIFILGKTILLQCIESF